MERRLPKLSKFLVEKNATQQPIVCFRSDRTDANMGSSEGVIHHREIPLGNLLHYLTCQIQGYTLLFREFVDKYDGKRSDPERWCCPIGNQIKLSLGELPVVAFQTTNSTDLPVLNKEVMEGRS